MVQSQGTPNPMKSFKAPLCLYPIREEPAVGQTRELLSEILFFMERKSTGLGMAISIITPLYKREKTHLKVV